MDGVLVIDKPAGPTSHDVVALARRWLRERQIGHTGTLDPLATGVLPLVVGRATRLAQFLVAGDKVYDATIRLGFATDTFDASGRPVPASPASRPSGGERRVPSRPEIEAALTGLVGTYPQQPPVYSAKKVAGERAYTLARRDLPVRLEPAVVTAYRIVLQEVEGHLVRAEIACSTGFYVRTLAHELGVRLGTGAHLAALRRTRSGEFGLEMAVTLEALEQDREQSLTRLAPLDRLLLGLAAVVLTPEGAQRASHGHDIGPPEVTSPLPARLDGLFRLLDQGGRLLAIAEPGRFGGSLHPSVVLV